MPRGLRQSLYPSIRWELGPRLSLAGGATHGIDSKEACHCQSERERVSGRIREIREAREPKAAKKFLRQGRPLANARFYKRVNSSLLRPRLLETNAGRPPVGMQMEIERACYNVNNSA